MYSITASGIPSKGFEMLRVALTKQARAIARSPRHRLGGESGDEVIAKSDAACWRKVGIATPEKLVQQRLEDAAARASQLRGLLASEDVRVCTAVREREKAMLQQFQNRCIKPASATATHVCHICRGVR